MLPASQDVTFRYDVLGQRVGRVEGASSVVFVQAGQQIVADYDAGQIPGKPNHVYVYGSYIDEPIARRESGSLAYFHRNQQYSIVALSNSAGAVVERYSYTAHGQLSIYNAAGTVLSASAFDNRFTYTGREWDATLALHFFRARWYDPLAGRFISRDPLGYVDGMGLYSEYFSLSELDWSGESRTFFAAGRLGSMAGISRFELIPRPCTRRDWEFRSDICEDEILIGNADPGDVAFTCSCFTRIVYFMWAKGSEKIAMPKCGPKKCVEYRFWKQLLCGSIQAIGGCGRAPNFKNLSAEECHWREMAWAQCAQWRVKYQTCWDETDPEWAGHQEQIKTARSAAKNCGECVKCLSR